MTTESSDTTSIITIGELIDATFGQSDTNVVHHKYLQTVLYLLARQLRVLERRVKVQLGASYPVEIPRSSSTLSVTEVKLRAISKQIKKSKGFKEKKQKSLDKGPDQGSIPKDGKEQGSSAKSAKQTKSEKDEEKKGTESQSRKGKASSDKKSADQTRFDETTLPSEKTFSSTGTAITSATFKTDTTTTEKMTSEKASSEKALSVKTSSDKTSTDKTSSDKTTTDTTTTDKTTTDTTTTDKTSSDKTSTDRTSSHKTSSDQTSSTVKTSSDKTSSDEATLRKTTSDKTTADKTTADKTTADKTTADKTTGGKKTPGAKSTTTTKTTTEKTSFTSSGRTSMDRISEEKSSEEPQKKRTSTTELRTMGPQDYQKRLDEVEEMRERELRIIRQRADSREQREKPPTPIASMDSVEATYEKLLVVERVSPEEAEARAARERTGARRGDAVPPISVVTQEEFEALATTVRQIQKKFGPIGASEFPENAQLMQELRRGASLTDAMAALQLSARLEATEKTLKNMLSLVTELARQTSGIEVPSDVYDDIEVIFGGKDDKKRAEKGEGSKKRKGKGLELDATKSDSELSVQITLPKSRIDAPFTSKAATLDVAGIEQDNIEKITYSMLKEALDELHGNIMKIVAGLTTKSNANADNAFKLATKLEVKIESALKLGDKMENLESLVTEYAEQINILDTGLSSQMTNYQEELTQMQHDLETGLETMAEVLANTGGDATAVAELNGHFADLQTEIDKTQGKQKELKDIQNSLSIDLDMLRRRIEVLSETKADREEVADALRDKAGLEALNEMVSHEQFDAVQGDLEKQIRTAYDKFNNQEITWQKIIDDLLRDLSEKADFIQVDGLRESINHYLEDFREKINFIMNILGDPPAAALARRLHRDTVCLSCSAPAYMKIEEESVPKLPALRPPAIGAEGAKPKEDGDHGLCYPGYPIPHPPDPRAHVCKRWCGGSHTLVAGPISRVPPGVNIVPVFRKELGTDGKPYAVEEPVTKTACAQCILPPVPSPVPSRHHQKSLGQPLNMEPFDFRRTLTSALESDVTPPTIFYSD